MKWMRYTARVLVVLWAAFWIFFAVGSILWGDGGGEVSKKELLKGIVAVAGIIVMALGVVYLALRRELVSGICLTVIGLLCIILLFLNIVREGSTVSFTSTMLMMGGPPLVAGVFFLLSYWKTKKGN